MDAIVVVNNGSTDGTGDWLASQRGLHVLSQDNVGGSGGFYAGMREACGLSADPFSRTYRLGDVKLFWCAYCDGVRKRLGKMG